MKIPTDQNLHSQSYRSDRVEFVWVFQEKTGIRQFVFGVFDNGMCYIESGHVDSVGNYTDKPFYAQGLMVVNLTQKGVWGLNQEYPPCYNYFSFGQDLVSLANECIVYLR